MKKAAFIIATQYDNLGDLIINKCLIDELSKHIGLYVETTNVSNEFLAEISGNKNIMFLNKEHGFSFKDISLFKYLISNKKRFDYLFKSPGPMYYSKSSSLVGKIRKIAFDLIYWKNKINNGRSYVIGSEINFESSSLEKTFIRNSNQHFKYYLRSKVNVDYLKSLNIKNVEYIPDLCFLLNESVEKSRNENRRKVGVSFRNLNNDSLDHQISNSVEIYINFYRQKGYEIVFFYQVSRDFEYNSSLYDRFKSHENVHFRKEILTLNDISFYNNFESVLSNRLHVLLLGFVYNCIAIPIIDSNKKTNKISGIYKSIESTVKVREKLQVRAMDEIYENFDMHTKAIEEINVLQLELCQNKIRDIFID